MKRICTIVFLTTGLLSSCSNSEQNLEEFMVNVSEFTIDDQALEDFEYVEVLGATDKLTGAEENVDFYNLVVVRSVKTGDTVNVLTTQYRPIDLSDGTTRFISNNTFIGKALERTGGSEDINGLKPDEIKAKSFDKVFYDHEFIQVDVRKYPAITGNLGDYTIEGNPEDFDF